MKHYLEISPIISPSDRDKIEELLVSLGYTIVSVTISDDIETNSYRIVFSGDDVPVSVLRHKLEKLCRKIRS